MSQHVFTSHQLLEILSLSKNATAVYTTEDILIQTANDAMIAFWGKDRSVIGKPLLEAVPELAGQSFITILQQVWNTGITYHAKEMPTQLLENGQLSTFYFDFSYEAINDEGGNMYCILHTATDVTDRYNANRLADEKNAEIQLLNTMLEEKIGILTSTSTSLQETDKRLLVLQNDRENINDKLKENELRLQSILDTMAEGVGIIDTTGQIIYANRMAQQILGLEESKIKQRTYHDPQWLNLRLDGSALPQEEHPMYIMMTTGQSVVDCEIGVQPPNGERFYISINAAPLFDATGSLIGGIGTFMDVTSRRKDIQDKDSFLSIASHELKTPLTSLKASIQMLDKIKDAPPPQMLTKIINNCLRSMDRINNLVEELLDTNKITQGNLVLNVKEHNVKSLLDNCCYHVRAAGTHQLIVQGDENLKIIGDDHRIDQVLDNLVNNAVKYAPDSNVIILSFEAISNYVKLMVTDFGQGIDPAQVPYLFDKYYQVSKIGNTNKAGLGLGLFISAEIIKRHGGQMGVDSAVGKGSTFWFNIPIA